MSKIPEVFLGILTAMGGFVEIGELTFSLNAGVKFGYGLLWIEVLGTLGIILYCEMSGRIAAVCGQPVFNVIRERVGFRSGVVTLIAANAVNLLTCAAEIGGVALMWQLLSDWPYRLLVLLALIFFLLVVWFFSFEWIERVFGLGGLLMVVFIWAAYRLQPDWQQMGRALIPLQGTLPAAANATLYAYFAVALLSSILMPYETYFYASGAIEDRWKPSDVALNRGIVIVGFVLGSMLSVSLMVIGADFFQARRIDPQSPGMAAAAVASLMGKAGLFAALGGMFFAFAGAAIETALSGGYNLAQFMGWPWGKFRRPAQAARFSLTWIAILILAALIILTGVDPISVVEYSIVFSVIILPFTFFPLLVVSGDRSIMGRHANGWLANSLGWFFLVLVTVAALAALPLFIITHGGQG